VSYDTRVLAFTPSRHRPLYLDRCIKQMQLQTYPCEHFVYLNSPDSDEHESLRALAAHLIADNPEPRPPIITVGESARQHANYLTALAPADLDEYDLFVRVDDDDFYGRRYVENCVAEFEANRWDFSGCYSHGAIDNGRWLPGIEWRGLGQNARDKELGVPEMMPPTYALSRRALDAVLGLVDDEAHWEDAQWRLTLQLNREVRVAVRSQTDFVYHRHPGNISMSGATGG
jgi:hypothetical protein